MRTTFSLLVILFFSFQASTQVVYLSTFSEIYRFNLDDCSTDLVTDITSNVSAFDISFHPDGSLYGINSSGNLYTIDMATGQTNTVHDFSGQGFNSMTVDQDGIIYAAATEGEVYTYDLNTDTEIYHGEMPYGAAGDLTFYNGDLYCAVDLNLILKVDLDDAANSEIAISDDVTGSIFGIVSFAEDCSDITTYAISQNFGLSYVYEIDYEAAQLNFLCTISLSATGGASAFEFLGSAPIVIDDVDIQFPGCSVSDGTIDITASGGVGGISYSIDGVNFSSSGFFDNLSAQQYVITITDNNNCSIIDTVDLTQNNIPIVEDLIIMDEDCGMMNGTIEVVVSSGVGPYEYSINGGPFQTSMTFTGQSAGNYDILVRDASGCESEIALAQLLNIGSPSVNIDPLNPSTCNQDNGSFTAMAIGDNPPFEYSLDGTNFQTSGSFTALGSATYMLTVMDASGCIHLETIMIDMEPVSSITSIDVTPSSCELNNGVLEISTDLPSGVMFSINGQDYQNANSFTSLADGDYTVYLLDQNGCGDTLMTNIPANPSPVLPAIDVIDASCNEPNGSLINNDFDIVNNISYSLDGSTYFQQDRFDNLSGGNYTLFIRNEANCVRQLDFEVLDTPPLLISEIQQTDPDCGSSNGVIQVALVGGTSPFEVSLDQQSTLLGSEVLFESLPFGEYLIKAKDVIGCEAEQLVSLDQILCPFYVPNVFTPNGDGFNDFFGIFVHPSFAGTIDLVEIYDRWGNLILSEKQFEDLTLVWDGRVNDKPVENGVYAYIIKLTRDDGSDEVKSGDLNIIR